MLKLFVTLWLWTAAGFVGLVATLVLGVFLLSRGDRDAVRGAEAAAANLTDKSIL